MTDEQIKQNAYEYYQKLDSITIEDPREPNVNSIIDAYTVGAHSRDEEIKEMKDELESLRKGFYKRGDKLKELMLANNKLRNPWISVEDRLPDKWKRLKVYQGTGEECYSWITKDVFVIKDGWETPEIAFYDYDAKIWWSEFGDNIENLFGEPTHWMYIPQIEKEEVR